jgi:hypothetical protein
MSLAADAARLPGYAVDDDAGNNINICNLSNFKIVLTEELMINIIHTVWLLSIWYITTDSLSHYID